MSDVTELLEQLDALRERATAGQWICGSGRSDDTALVYAPTSMGPARRVVPIAETTTRDGECMAALVNAYPLLRAALLEMRRENERLRVYLGHIVRIGNDEETRDITPDVAIDMAQTLADEALAKGGGR